MTAGTVEDGTRQAAHTPVLVEEVVDALSPRLGALIVDGTFGAGGYSRALLNRGADVVALDRDPSAHERAARSGIAHREGLELHRIEFSRMEEALGERGADGVTLDVGVSSMQLDEAERGFSFMRDGPLDMRMASEGPSAADVVNRLALSDLLRVIGILGEERNAPRIARAIVSAREDAPIETTARLADIVAKAAPGRPNDRINPATRTFQGLRIYVNDELNELARALEAAERCLLTGGVLAVVTFHSLEDRIVKRFTADRSVGARGSRHMPQTAQQLPTFEPVGKQGRGPSDAEIARNPRARSARLRVARRTDAPARNEIVPPLHDLPPIAALGAIQ